MKFFNGVTAKNKMPPAVTAAPNTSNTTAAPTLAELSTTLWRSTSETGEAGKPSRSKYDKVSRRSSMESIPNPQPNGSTGKKSSEHRCQPQSDRELLDSSKMCRQEPIRRSGNIDPIGKAVSTGNGGQRAKQDDKKEIHHMSLATGLTSKDKERRKKRQQDAPQEGGIDRALDFVTNTKGGGGGEEQQSNLKEKSFQDVLKNVKVGKTPHNGVHNNEPHTLLSRSVPEHKPQADTDNNTKLNLPGFKSTPTSALESLLATTHNFSSDCSISTLNTTTQCALSLGTLIEEMQIEFQKLKNQKNKAESYAEKLHTDYVRMQEELEREYEKVCYERNELKVAKEKDTMAIDKLKEELKFLKAENAALKESTKVGEERWREAEEENGRMKIALEALLVRSGALKKDTVKPGRKEEITSRDTTDRRREPSNDSHSSSSLPRTSEQFLRRQSSSSSRPLSVSCSPEVRSSRPSLVYPQSADCIKPSLTSIRRDPQDDSVRLPFDSYGNGLINSNKRMPPFDNKPCFDNYQRNSTMSTEASSPISNQDEDNESFVSNHTNNDTLDEAADTP